VVQRDIGKLAAEQETVVEYTEISKSGYGNLIGTIVILLILVLTCFPAGKPESIFYLVEGNFAVIFPYFIHRTQ
jgi:hypothetical protein